MFFKFLVVVACATVLSVDLPGFATTYTIVTEGKASAPVVAKGDTVTVHATGIVAGPPEKKFWSTKDPGQKPFEYKAGVGGVITGTHHIPHIAQHTAHSMQHTASYHHVSHRIRL